MATVGRGSSAKPSTILDVAAAAGVSRQTVTRALNDLPDVSPATKQRVQDAAAALNYRPNRAAQRLVRGGDATLGFVVGDLRNPYYPQLAAELTRRAAEHDWGVVITDLAGRHGAERVEAMASRVDAVVGHLGPEHSDLVPARVPTVLLGECAEDSAEHAQDAPPEPADGRAQVRFDYAGGMRDAVAHLVATGRRHVAMIDSEASPTPRARLLLAALRERGLEPATVIPAPDTHEGGVAAARRVLDAARDAGTTADAVLCFNDVLAVGALKGFARAGIRVPQDVAVIGIDGLDIGTLVTPELTTLAVDMRRLASHAIDLVDALLKGESGDELRRTVTHRLVLRESA